MSRPVVGMVSRLVEQKGLDLIKAVSPTLVGLDATWVFLGSGEGRYERWLENLAGVHPSRVGAVVGFDESLAHLVEAGSDAFLMPSKFEPCGLNQMYSLRYGTVPIVRRTGGLAASVQHFDPDSGEGNGVVFNDFDAGGVRWALATALEWYRSPLLWRRIVRNGMRADFSWDKQVGAYEALYGALTGE